MGIMLTATFDTRRDAEMTVERLVQEFDVDRTAISIASEGDANTAGDLLAGSDTAADQPGQDDRDDAPLQGAIVVTAEVENEEAAELVRAAFFRIRRSKCRRDGIATVFCLAGQPKSLGSF